MTIKVLLIDDDREGLTVTAKSLEAEDSSFDVTPIESAESARTLLSETQFDVIVCDYELKSGMNGLDFLNWIRETNPSIPFIIFTGKSREEVAIRALNLGANAYITKDIDVKYLYSELAYSIRSNVAHYRAKLALVESDARFRAAFEDAAIGMAIISLEQKIIHVNSKFCEMLGLKITEVLGTRLESFMHPDEIEQVSMNAQSSSDKDITILSGEYRLFHSEKRWIWVRTTSSIVRNRCGEPIHFVSQFIDITETKLAIEALQDSEKRFRGAFEDAAIGMALINFNLSHIHCNRALTEMLGYSSEELNKLKFEAITHPDDIYNTPTVIDGKFPNGTTTIRLEKRYIHKDGHIVHTSISSSILHDDDGNPLYFVTQFQDITEQRMALEALASSERKYKTLVEQSLQNYAIIQDGKYVYVNDAFANTIGMAPDELMKLDSDGVWKLVHPDDVLILKKRDELLENEAKELSKTEFRYVRPDGEIRWVEGLVREIQYDGKPARQIVEIDITSRKQYEDALRENLEFLDTLLNTLPNPVFFKDVDGCYRRCNPAFALEIMGLPVEEVIGKSTKDLMIRIKDMNMDDVIQLDKEILDDHTNQSFEVQIEDSEGGYRTYLVNRSVFKSKEDKVLGIVGVLQDITDLRELQAKLTRQKAELSEFAQVMSHDIQGSLHNALLFAELLEEECSKENLNGLKDMLMVAQAILRRSLQLAEAGLVIGDLEPVALNELVDEIAAMELQNEIAFVRDDLPTIRCDRAKTTQIFSNLIRNAVEHGKPSTIEIRVVIKRTYVYLRIINDGELIPDNIRKNILKKAFSSRKGGGGLGLMIVKKLVEAHDWSIELENTKKTTFRIRIPKTSIVVKP